MIKYKMNFQKVKEEDFINITKKIIGFKEDHLNLTFKHNILFQL